MQKSSTTSSLFEFQTYQVNFDKSFELAYLLRLGLINLNELIKKLNYDYTFFILQK